MVGLALEKIPTCVFCVLPRDVNQRVFLRSRGIVERVNERERAKIKVRARVKVRVRVRVRVKGVLKVKRVFK